MSTTPLLRLFLVLAIVAAGCGGDTEPETTAPPSTVGGPTPASALEIGSTPSSGETPAPTPGAGPPSATAAPAAPCGGPLGAPTTHRYRDDVADDQPELVSLDVYQPTRGTGCPVLVWVHGGGWRRGDKQGNGIDTKVALAADLGATLVSTNYRLADPALGIGWPVYGDDVAQAVAWVVDHADELGVDASRLALVGHSAGAHLVSIVATNPRLIADTGHDPTVVSCVVALDTAAYLLTAADVASPRGVYFAAFGDDPAGLADASPLTQAQEAPGPLPHFFVVTRGSASRIAESRRFVDVLHAAGTEAQLLEAGGYTHAEVNSRLGAADDEVLTPAIAAFLRDCLVPTPTDD